jgi:histidine kinase/DNA gyrase B/HSP90-like ATPase
MNIQADTSVPLVSGGNFVLATRDTGYRNTASAIAELIDNAIEAEARNIRICARQDGGTGEFSISVIDDGRGIPPSMLSQALQFGGTTRFNNRTGLGRFGMGLPNSSMSQAKRVEVYSWQRPDSVWFSYLDVDDVASGKSNIPRPNRVPLPLHLDLSNEHGTAIQWMKCDRLQGRRLDTLISNLHGTLGRVFRYFLWDGLALSLNEQPIRPIDPLFCRTSPFAAHAESYGGPLSYDIRTGNGTASRVVATFSELPLQEWHDVSNLEKRTLGIAKGAGVSIVRARREIAYGWYLLGDKRKENYDDWWRCEVCFEPELDEHFGVTHSKQGVRPSSALEASLGVDLERIAHDLNRRVRQRYALIRSSEDSRATILAKRRDVLLPSVVRSKSSSPESARGRHKEAGRPGYLVVFETTPNGDFYAARRRAKNIELVINPDHPFYRKIYGPLRAESKNVQERFRLECLLLALARVDVTRCSQPEKEVADRRRSHWSDVIAAFLQRA